MENNEASSLKKEVQNTDLEIIDVAPISGKHETSCNKNLDSEKEKKEEMFPEIGLTSPSRMQSNELSCLSSVMSASKAARRLKQKRQLSKDKSKDDNDFK